MPFRAVSPATSDMPPTQRYLKPIVDYATIRARERVRSPVSPSNIKVARSNADNDDTVDGFKIVKSEGDPRNGDRLLPEHSGRRDRSREGANWNEDGSYKVGKGKPSPNHYFPKGKSGNPKGRPKGRRSINAQAGAIFDVKVPLKFNGEARMLDITGVALTKLYELVAKGNIKAITQVLAIQRERYPEPLSASANTLTSEDLSLIDAILTEAGFGTSPVSRAGRGELSATLDTSPPEEI